MVGEVRETVLFRLLRQRLVQGVAVQRGRGHAMRKRSVAKAVVWALWRVTIIIRISSLKLFAIRALRPDAAITVLSIAHAHCIRFLA
jgi:hypothetical protein